MKLIFHLTCDGLGKVATDVSRLWIVDGVSTHLGHNVLSEDDYLLSTELNSGGISQELAPGYREC